MKHDTVLRWATQRVYTHTLQLRELQRHMEDLDNRGRRHNLRICGLPKSVEREQLSPTVTSLLNYFLNRPAQTVIDMEMIH